MLPAHCREANVRIGMMTMMVMMTMTAIDTMMMFLTLAHFPEIYRPVVTKFRPNTHPIEIKTSTKQGVHRSTST